MSNKKASRQFIPELPMERFYSRLRQGLNLAPVVKGRVTEVTGLLVKARLPLVRIGDVCLIEPRDHPPVQAQVVGFKDDEVYLTPVDPLEGVGPHASVTNTEMPLSIGVSSALLGRVIDALGKPIDGKGPIQTEQLYPLRMRSPLALERKRIDTMIATGVRSIDLLCTLGEGQRIGIFSTAGVGKSSLIGTMVRRSSADINVLALIGERGREVLDILEENLGPEGLERSVVIVSTSDDPPLRRILAAYTATAIAEYFRDQGQRVMLFMDSLTRFARGLREIALSLGEPPARQGFPPSVFATLPELLERAGKTAKGSITGIYSVLLSSEQIEDPLAEEIRAILDGHLILTSRLSRQQIFPALDLQQSSSRLFSQVATEEQKVLAERIRQLWSTYEENRDLISLAAYRKGSDSTIDQAIEFRPKIVQFLRQAPNEGEVFSSTMEKARAIFK
jgi:FliI/YscN family ATPase